MNDKFDELRIRIQAADPAQNTPELNHTVVAKAPLTQKAKRFFGFKTTRLGLGGASAVAVTALALTLSANLGTQPLIQMAVGGPESLSAGDSKMMAGSDGTVGIWPGYWVQNEYSPGADLSTEQGSGNVYQLVMVGNSSQRLQQIADIFGIEGSIKQDEWSSEQYPSYSIGTPNRQVSLSWNGTGSWYFSSWAESEVRSETREDSSEMVVDDFKPTPELLPSESEVIAKALEIFNSTGLKISASDIRTYRDDWGTGAFASLKVAGQDTAIEWSIGYDSTGELTYASGHSVEAIERGDFNTISAFDAVDRIADGRWWGNPANSVWEQYGSNAPMLKADNQIQVDPEMGIYPEGEEQFIPEIQKLVIERSTATMLMIYDKSGSAWLVPGYLLHNDKGWFDAVISLEEGVIELYEPIETGPENLKIDEEPAQG
jgi:hypothetical protein